MAEIRQIPEQQLAEIKDNFQFFDRDGNGEIDEAEFTQLLQVISPSTSAEQGAEGFSIVDENNDGHIDLEEFIAWWQTCWWEY
ncbi:EF-hand domain-containing protein [Aliikangiella sp. IMCC44359]|uniref:EF-hand domain-containing protein n=1 Tax=Aliikangiella sp. IMCC44359 TaxID=3459125 RepID=UPI00403AB4C1